MTVEPPLPPASPPTGPSDRPASPPSDPPSDRPASVAELDALEAQISVWLDELAAENPMIEAVDRDPALPRRWFVRLQGEERDHTTVWLHLRQRTLHHETYLLPTPVDDPAAVYEHLLRRNVGLHGVAFAIGDEDATYVVGETPLALVDRAAVDAILGTHHQSVERVFRTVLRLGFGSLLGGDRPGVSTPPAG